MQELTQDLSNYLVNKLQSMSGDRSIDEIVEFYLKKIGATNTQILGKPLLGIEGNTIVIADFKDMHIRTIVLVKHWLKEADESVIKQIPIEYP